MRFNRAQGFFFLSLISLLFILANKYVWTSSHRPNSSDHWKVQILDNSADIPKGKILLESHGVELFSEGFDEVIMLITPHIFVDIYPITIQQYKQFSEETGRSLAYYPFLIPGKEQEASLLEDGYPVSIGTPEQATAYCAWRGERLLMESEWLLAACGTDGRTYPWGEKWITGKANVNSKSLLPIDQFPTDIGVQGIRGVVGNVMDLVIIDHPTDAVYALRGGGWDMTPLASRCDSRIVLDPSYNQFVSMQIGFRCAKVIQNDNE